MGSEQVIISPEACEIVNKAKGDGHRVCVVGVSTARATESSVGTDGMLKEFDGWTNKFIFPPYEFGMANCMIGNFYHPESTMMMTECSFGGYDLVYDAYKKAVKNGYKFGCYGDAMLILDD
jgi:S-adenosylmethionine:tRNA ribosyltransferase-isomerase